MALIGTISEKQSISKLPTLGTVSQTAGVPTGSIIERGSNANGEYVRFADGTMFCYASGSGWSGSYVTKSQTMPASDWSTTPAVTWNSIPTTNQHVMACVWKEGSASWSFRHPDSSTQTYWLSAFGRWF